MNRKYTLWALCGVFGLALGMTGGLVITNWPHAIYMAWIGLLIVCLTFDTAMVMIAFQNLETRVALAVMSMTVFEGKPEYYRAMTYTNIMIVCRSLVELALIAFLVWDPFQPFILMWWFTIRLLGWFVRDYIEHQARRSYHCL